MDDAIAVTPAGEGASLAPQRVLIGWPAWDGIVTEAQRSALGMVYRIGRDMPDVDLAIEVMYKREQFRARNQIVDAAIAADIDWLLFLDDDMIVPHNLLQRLMAHDKDVVGALYFQRGGAYEPVIMQRKSHEPGQFAASYISMFDPMVQENRGLHQVDVIGGGCMLFKMHVFKSLLQPYFESERAYGTDLSICGRLQDQGHEIYVDTTIELGHVGEKKIITSRSIPMAERALAKVNIELATDIQAYLGMHEEQMVSAMDRAAGKGERQANWVADPNNWSEIAEYYRNHGEWHILNLGYFNLYKTDPHKEWALTEGLAMLRPGSQLLDYGSGLGHISVPLARAGHTVYAIDIADSPTLTFVEWRVARHKLETLVPIALYTEIPGNSSYHEMFDGAFCISVLDHLTQPRQTVEWIGQQIKSGGFFVCEWALHSGADEPQHLDRHEPETFEMFMHSIGFTSSPEHRWLFFKD